MADRRLKRFLLSLDDLGAILQGETVEMYRYLPRGSRIVSAEWSHRAGALDLLVCSDVYPDQSIGGVIPLESGPIIAEETRP